MTTGVMNGCDMAPVLCKDGKRYEVDCTLATRTCACIVDGVTQRTVPDPMGCRFETCNFQLTHP